ncbi:hypothetical protein F0U60_18200 [Archangium minus]|uniref:Uncharacterized protein n=1 Tax=Archangium minus TaxID=83450 RepID=A0ABY9WPU6_9BACT|nr:hypothetical protein F0U60_18200 [Archangium minus]
MSMPKWFRFSVIPAPLDEVFESTAALREAHVFKARDMARLSWGEDSGQLEFQTDSIQTIRKDSEALEVACDWDGFAVAYNILSIRATIYMHFWKQESSTCVALEIDGQVPYIKVTGMAEGEWLERFAIEYTEACGASSCAYGRDWPIEFVALEPEQLVGELRSGKLLKRPLPGFYMLSQALLGKEELATLLLGQERDSRLRYFRTPAGYHALSSLCQRSWW